MPQKPKKTHWTMSFLMSDAFVSFLNLIPEAAIISLESGQIILTNHSAQELFQYSAEAFCQMTIEDLVPEKVKLTHPKLRSEFFKHPTPRYLNGRNIPLSARKKNGIEFPMDAALFALPTEQGFVAINLIKDISNQKKNRG